MMLASGKLRQKDSEFGQPELHTETLSGKREGEKECYIIDVLS